MKGQDTVFFFCKLSSHLEAVEPPLCSSRKYSDTIIFGYCAKLYAVRTQTILQVASILNTTICCKPKAENLTCSKRNTIVTFVHKTFKISIWQLTFLYVKSCWSFFQRSHWANVKIMAFSCAELITFILPFRLLKWENYHDGVWFIKTFVSCFEDNWFIESCGNINHDCPCMINSKCSKNYPKEFNNTTTLGKMPLIMIIGEGMTSKSW